MLNIRPSYYLTMCFDEERSVQKHHQLFAVGGSCFISLTRVCFPEGSGVFGSLP